MAFGRCPDGWKIVKLNDLGEVNRGRSRHRPRYAEHLYGGPYPFIQTGDIKASGGKITKYYQTYSKAGLSQSRLWPVGTLCITIAANIAETGILTFPACFPDSVIGFIPDSTKCDVYFIEYTFRNLKRMIQHEATGSVQDNINLETLERLRFPIPLLPEQRAIAHILGTLDDKIELNRRLNETLEAMARAIFKSWFVDFDPVRTKAEGRQPDGLDADTAALFPDALEDSPLGKIPMGWEISSFAQLVEIWSGGTPKTSIDAYWNGDIPWFTVTDAPSEGDIFVIDTGKYITQAGVDNSATRLLPVGTTIISARGTVGKLAMVGRPMAMNQTCYGLKGKKGYPDPFIYFQTKALVEELKQRTHGCVFDTIIRDTFKMLEVASPPPNVAEAFGAKVEPILQKIYGNLLESRTLAAIRDTLLPKLLSGEVRIKEAERLIGVRM